MSRRLRIAIMLRALDERGGIAVYARNITEELLAADHGHRYILIYATDRHVGQYAGHANAIERLVRAPNKLLWDQVSVPWLLRRMRADVLFHPKFTVPISNPTPSVMVLHGADWFFPEQARYYGSLNAAYMRRVLPLFCRRATRVISVSKLTTEDIARAVPDVANKVETVYFAPARHFGRVENPAELERVRRRYDLPERFIFTLSKPLGDARKNLSGILEGYRKFHGTTGHKLVVGGEDCIRYRALYRIPEEGWGADVLFPGWIDQSDMPAVYSLADLYLYPSNLEAFPIPITEAMSCGTPIVTSDANGLREIAGDAAIRVDPADPGAIAEAMRRVVSDPRLRAELARRGLERAGLFSWTRCASTTLRILEDAASRNAA